MAVSLSTFGGVGAQFFDNNGVPLAGGKIYSYLAGTTTPTVVYASSSGSTPHSNPIILDSAGRVPGGEIWQTLGQSCKFVVYTAGDILIASYDNVSTVSSVSAIKQVFTGTGAQTIYTLSQAPLSANTTNIYINGIYQQKSTYTLSSTTLTFSEAPPLAASIEVVYL